ncbi:C-signal-like [Ptychodera flava]|uniref:C-signal-like n=1 Tax=Ptychodera flava TaxID=63121 RepID=UPI003969CDE6
MDIRDTSSIDSAAKQVEARLGESGLNLLINNAGILTLEQKLEDVTAEGMRRQFETNCIGPTMVIKRFVPLLRRASQSFSDDRMSTSRAAIVNISSGLGSLEDNRPRVDLGYRCSKVALNMVTKNMSVMLKADHILSVAINPGWVRTDMGGPGADLSPEESVEGMINVMATRTNEHSGYCYTHKGDLIPR